MFVTVMRVRARNMRKHLDLSVWMEKRTFSFDLTACKLFVLCVYRASTSPMGNRTYDVHP